MKSYRLTELIDIGPGNPSILIPCFATDGSNAAFVQQVTPDGSIEFMKEVEYHQYNRIVSGFSEHSVDARGSAIFAIRWIDQTIKVGSLRELQKLDWNDPELSSWPFFALDAVLLFGGDEHAALNGAAKLLGDQGANWLEMEVSARKISIRKRVIPPIPKGLLAALQQLDTLEAGEWARRWLSLWGKYRGEPALAKAAFDWFSSRIYHSAKSVLILAVLLKSPDHGQAETAVEVGRNWLTRRSWLRGTWAKVWIKIIPYSPEDRVLKDLAFQYLHDMASPEHGIGFPNDWPRLWRWLWEEGENVDALVELGLNGLSTGGRSRRFYKSVTSALLFSQSNHIGAVVFDWMMASENKGPGWADTCVFFLNDPARQYSTQQKGMEYISSPRYYDTRGWPTIWLALVDTFGPSEELMVFGDRWIRQASQKLTKWPELLHRRLQIGTVDVDVARVAKQWLDEHRDHPYAAVISAEIGEPREVSA